MLDVHPGLLEPWLTACESRQQKDEDFIWKPYVANDSFRVSEGMEKVNYFFQDRFRARTSFFTRQNYTIIDGRFCEMVEGICFSTTTKLDPEECRAYCTIADMDIPSFYQLECVCFNYFTYILDRFNDCDISCASTWN